MEDGSLGDIDGLDADLLARKLAHKVKDMRYRFCKCTIIFLYFITSQYDNKLENTNYLSWELYCELPC